MNAHEIVLGDVTNCDRPEVCETCGAVWALEMVVLDTSLGVFCARQCHQCVVDCVDPPLADNLAAARRVAEHCEHLGITQRRMYEILDEEKYSDQMAAL